MGTRLNSPRLQVADALGRPLAGAKLYSFLAGTSTPASTFSNSAESIANPNPVVADAAGYFGDIFLASGQIYKFRLDDAFGNTIWTADNVTDRLPYLDPTTGLIQRSLIPSPPRALLQLSVPVPIPNNANTVIPWDKLGADDGGYTGSLPVTGFSAPQDGAYTVVLNVQWDTTSSSGTRIVAINVAGLNQAMSTINATAGTCSQSVVWHGGMLQGHIASAVVAQSSGGSLNVTQAAASNFAIIKH